MEFKNKYIKYKNKYISIQNGAAHTIKLLFSDYNYDNFITNIGKLEFYNFYDKSKRGKFAIVNGANVRTDDFGTGTTKGIRIMNNKYNDKLFYMQRNNTEKSDNGEIIFNSSDLPNDDYVKRIISDGSQIFKVEDELYLNAGSVYKIKSIVPENRIGSVYHLKGVSLPVIKSTELEERLKNLVFIYYNSILEDFERNGLEEYIYIPQIPGDAFNGTDITRKVLCYSIYNYMKTNSNSRRSFTIILGVKEDIYFSDISEIVKTIKKSSCKKI